MTPYQKILHKLAVRDFDREKLSFLDHPKTMESALWDYHNFVAQNPRTHVDTLRFIANNSWVTPAMHAESNLDIRDRVNKR